MNEKFIIETIREFCEKQMDVNEELATKGITLKGDYLEALLDAPFHELLCMLEEFEKHIE